MSNFTCEHCQTPILENMRGEYYTECEHYPMEGKMSNETELKPILMKATDGGPDIVQISLDDYKRLKANARAETRWIPVSERLPDSARILQVTIAGLGLRPAVKEGYYHPREGWMVRIMSAGYEKVPNGISVTAWKESPPTITPYQPDEEPNGR